VVKKHGARSLGRTDFPTSVAAEDANFCDLCPAASRRLLRRKRMCRGHAERFKAKFVAATEYTDFFRTSAARAFTRLIQLGLRPAITRKECRKMFFRRAEVENALSQLDRPPTGEQIRQKFWAGLEESLRRLEIGNRAPRVDYRRVVFSSGMSEVSFAVIFASDRERIRVGFTLNNNARPELRQFLRSQVASIAGEAMLPLKWMSRKKGGWQWVLAEYARGELFDQSIWPDIHGWVAEGLARLMPAVKKRLLDFRHRYSRKYTNSSRGQGARGELASRSRRFSAARRHSNNSADLSAFRGRC